MLVAGVQLFDVAVFVHIAAVLLAFGPTFGYAVFQTIAERHDPRSIPTIMRSFETIDRNIGTPAALVLIASGIYLTIDRWAFSDAFVSIGIIVIVILLGLVHGFFIPHERKLRSLAERDIKAASGGEVTLSEEYQAVSKRVAMAGTMTGLVVIVTIYLMSAKPFV